MAPEAMVQLYDWSGPSSNWLIAAMRGIEGFHHGWLGAPAFASDSALASWIVDSAGSGSSVIGLVPLG
jgi:hypothetical protein